MAIVFPSRFGAIRDPRFMPAPRLSILGQRAKTTEFAHRISPANTKKLIRRKS